MDHLIIFTAEYLWMVSLLLAGIYWLWVPRENKIRMGALALISFPLAYAMAKLLERLIYDPRPFVVEHLTPLIAHAADNGFPSDHTLLTMALASVIFAYNKTLGTILFMMALLVGTARVLAHLHQPLDILGSTVIVLGSVGIAFWVLRRLLPDGERVRNSQKR